jgi:hypothetical protein
MAKQLDQKEQVRFKELLMANSIQVDALSQSREKVGFIYFLSYFNSLDQNCY